MATVKKSLEKDIQKVILEWLKLQGITAWRQNSGKVYVKGRCIVLAPEGTSDIIGYMPDGRFLAIEVKQPGYIPTEEQYAFIAAAASDGCVATWTSGLSDLFMEYINQEIARGKA